MIDERDISVQFEIAPLGKLTSIDRYFRQVTPCLASALHTRIFTPYIADRCPTGGGNPPTTCSGSSIEAATPTLRCQRLHSCGLRIRGLPTQGALRPRGYGPLRPHRMLPAPWSNGPVRNGRPSQFMRANMRAAAQTPRAKSNLSVRRDAALRWHVRIRRLNPGGILHAFLICSTSSARFMSSYRPTELPAAGGRALALAMRNPTTSKYITSTTPHSEGATHVHHYLILRNPWEPDELSSARKNSSEHQDTFFTTGSGL